MTNNNIASGIKQRIHSIFSVKEKVLVTPHYIRIKFAMTDQQGELFKNAQIGGHNKIFIPAEGAEDARRTYTTRNIDFANKELWIDFVAHGDNGPASYWANRAMPGSTLGIAMKDGSKPLFPEANEYLLIGDSTALPVIGCMLEQLPAGVKVHAVLEVYGAEDEIALNSKANLSVQWLHNRAPEKGSRLSETVRGLKLPEAKRFVFAAAEYDVAKDLKRYFKEELTWPQSDYSVVSYWKKGESEEESSDRRREERQR